MDQGSTRGTVVIGGGQQKALTNLEEEVALKIVQTLMGSIGKFQQYPSVNELVQAALDECYQTLSKWLRTHPALECVGVQSNLQVNQAFLSVANQAKDFVQAFVFFLTERNIKTLTFRVGVKKEELQRFCEFLKRPAKQIVGQKNLARSLKRMGLRRIDASSELILEGVVVKTQISDDLTKQLSKLDINDLLEKANILSKLDIQSLHKVADLATVVTNLSYTKNEDMTRQILDRLAKTLHSDSSQARLTSARAFSQIADKAVDYTLFGLHTQVGSLMTDQLANETDPGVFGALASGLEKAAQVYIAQGDYDQAMRVVASFGRQVADGGTRVPQLRQRAETAIHSIANPAAVRKLVQSLERGEQKTKMKAVSLLAQSGRNAVPPLVDLIYSADDPATVNLAIDALTKIGPPILAEVYQELQEDMDENYRAVFLRLVGEVGDVHSLLKISHFYLDPSERIAGEALRSTCKIGGPAAAAKALEVFALRSFSEEFVKARMFDFGAYKLKGVVEALVAFFDGKGVFAKYTNSDIKAMAARTLGQIGGPEAVAGLCNVLTAKKGFLGFGKGDEKLEAAACTALGMIGDPTAEAALQKAAQSKFDAVRSAAELALKALKKKSAGTAGTAATVAAAPTKVAEARTFAKAAPDASTQVAPPPAQAPTVIAGPPPGTQRVRIYLTVGQMILDNVRVAIAGVDETGKPTANQLGADFDLKPGEYDVVIRDEGFSITKKIKVEDQPAEFRFDLQSAFNF